jgi:ketol-acid reductoisomerase
VVRRRRGRHLVAPKGSGTSVRTTSLRRQHRSSYAVHRTPQDAEERCLALGIGIGSVSVLATFAGRTNSDLTSERGV